MPFDSWESYDGYRTREDAEAAARDLRKSLADWAPDTQVAVKHMPNDSLEWHVMVKGKH
jgi:hypothetical protein